MITDNHQATRSLFAAALIILLRRQGGEMSITQTEYDEVFGMRISQRMEPNGTVTIKVLPVKPGAEHED